MEKRRQPGPSSLFLVRLWVDEVAGEDAPWRGRVLHILSGQAHDFRDWQTLSRFFLEMMLGAEATPDLEADEDGFR